MSNYEGSASSEGARAPGSQEGPAWRDVRAGGVKGTAEGVLVLPLSSDRGGAAVVQKFYAANGIDGLPVLLDPKGEAARA